MGMYKKSEVYSHLQQVDIFCLQMDKLTDVAELAVLLAFLCYFCNADVQEDLILCKTSTTFIPRDEIFKILELFMNENEIPWKKYMGVCTDKVKSITGSINKIKFNKKGRVVS